MNYLVRLNYLVLPRVRVRVSLDYSISAFLRVEPDNSGGPDNSSQSAIYRFDCIYIKKPTYKRQMTKTGKEYGFQAIRTAEARVKFKH